MHAVGLVELRVARNAIEEKRIERDVVILGQGRIYRVERAVVLRPQIGRRPHAGDEVGNRAA